MMKGLETGRGLQQRLARDVQFVEMTNARIRSQDARVLAVLRKVTGQDLGEDPGKWRAWWADRLGYSYQPPDPQEKPTYTSFVTEPLPQASLPHHSCFGAGTLVRTLGGPKVIESIQVGDRLLSQDPNTGSMEFRSVVAVYHNKPASTLRLSIGGEAIVVTGIHRFWKAGKGWTMARDLKTGDRVRAVGGVVEVQSTEKSEVQPVFNLEVAENRDYFVGKQGMLVHDNSLVRPVAEPFDRERELGRLLIVASLHLGRRHRPSVSARLCLEGVGIERRGPPSKIRRGADRRSAWPLVRPWFGRSASNLARGCDRRRIGLTPEAGGLAFRPNHALTCVITCFAFVARKCGTSKRASAGSSILPELPPFGSRRGTSAA